MSNNLPQLGEELDIIKLTKFLWAHKFILLSSTLILLIAGAIVSQSVTPTYQSHYNIQQIMEVERNSSKKYLFLDFQSTFRNHQNFDDWKTKSPDSKLEIEHISVVRNLNGILFRIANSEEFISFVHLQDGEFELIAKTNEPQLLEDIYQYSNFVNNVVSMQILASVQNEINSMNGTKQISTSDTLTLSLETKNKSIEPNFSLDFPVSLALKLFEGRKVLNIDRPSIPQKTSVSKTFILILSLITGLIIGILIAILLNKKQLSKP